MKFFLDFLPGLVFLAVLLLPREGQDAIYPATVALIAATFAQLILARLLAGRFERQYVLIFLVVLVLGGATLLLKDERFIKWKPTIVFWVFSLCFLGSAYLGSRNLAARLMGQFFDAPAVAWGRVNLAFTAFFLLCGLLNLLVAYNFSTETWAAFKLFGFLLLNLCFMAGVVLSLSRYATAETEQK